MFEGNEDRAPRTAAESYASATGASNLRMEAHRVGAADSVGAAGMNPYQTGLLLLRLQSEWDRAAKPLPATRRQIEALAATYDTEPALIDGGLHTGPRRNIANKHAGLVKQERSEGRTSYRKPIEVAEEEAAHRYVHELGLLFMHLKTLPEVRRELEEWIGGPHAARLVADTLGWWLEPRCHTCRGSGKRIIQGTGGRDGGKVCWACRLSPTPGERPLAHSGVGRRLLAHIRACCGAAASEQRHVTRERSVAQEHERSMVKKHAHIAKLRKADEEPIQDERQRNETARQFAESMEKKRGRTVK